MGRPKGSKNKPKPAAEQTPAHIPDEHPVEEGELGTPHHVERNKQLEAIAQQNIDARKEEQDEELVLDEEAGEVRPATAEEKAGESEEGETSEEETELAAKGETSEEVDDKGDETNAEPTKRKFTIDGKEQELTEDEITAIVQKSGAVESRLKEATELLRDAKQTTSPAPATEAQPSASTSSETDAVDHESLVKELTDAFVYGNEEQVAEAVKKLLGEGRASQDAATQLQTMTPEQVKGYVVESIAFQEGTRLLDLPPDKGGYSDLWLDPVLKADFQRRENELRDAKDPRSYVELYTFIGGEVRAWRDKLIKKYTPKTGLEGRKEAKQKTGIVRGAGSNTVAQKESKPLSAQEKHDKILKEAAAARGQ